MVDSTMQFNPSQNGKNPKKLKLSLFKSFSSGKSSVGTSIDDPMMRESDASNEYILNRDDLHNNKMKSDNISGQIDKWTNYVSGFQKRWFVLKDGILSYYCNKDQVDVACRGSFKVSSLRLIIVSSTTFKLITKSGVTLHLRCADNKAATKWMMALNDDICKGKNSDIDSPSKTSYKEQILHRTDSLSDKKSLAESDIIVVNTEKPTEQSEANQETSSIKQRTYNLENELYIKITKKCDIILSLEELLQKYKNDLCCLTINNPKGNANVEQSRASGETSSQLSYPAPYKFNSKDTFDILERTVDNISKEVTELVPLIDSYRSYTLKSLRESFWSTEILQSNLKKLALQHNSLERRVENYCEQDRTYSKINNQNNHESSQTNIQSDTMSDEFQDALSGSMEISSLDRSKLDLNSDEFDSKSSSHDTSLPVSYTQPHSDRISGSPRMHISASTKSLNQTSLLNTNLAGLDLTSSGSTHKSAANFLSMVTYRKSIPPRPDVKLNLWSIIKNAIGRDLSKIPMPVNFNEPLSLLQRVTEPLQHSSLLDEAASAINDTLIQLVYIAGFNVSSYASNAYRTSKPFNPLLNETYEMDRTADLGWRSVCEQVTHHPPACTLFAEGKGWTYTENFNAKSKFRGKYLTVDMLGLAHIHMNKSKHDITWNKVTCSVNNIIIGTLSIDQTGTSEIVNLQTGDVCKLIFHSHSMFNKSMRRKVTGTVANRDGVVHYILDGKWDEGIKFAKVLSQNSDGSYETTNTIPLWTIEQLPVGADQMYNFTEFTCSLNQPDSSVAPTDSRNRQDQRCMEEGDFPTANQIKCALEQKQRLRRNNAINQLKAKGGTLPDHCDEAIDPVWFAVNQSPPSEALSTLYKYKGGYWEHKLMQDWDPCPNIFSLSNEETASNNE